MLIDDTYTPNNRKNDATHYKKIELRLPVEHYIRMQALNKSTDAQINSVVVKALEAYFSAYSADATALIRNEAVAEDGSGLKRRASKGDEQSTAARMPIIDPQVGREL